MKIQVNLPMLEVQPWDSECYALVYWGLQRCAVIHANNDFNLLRNHAYHSYVYHPYKFLLTPLDEEFRVANTLFSYKKCEYRILLYYRELESRYHGSKHIPLPLGFARDMETLKYMGINGIHHDK